MHARPRSESTDAVEATAPCRVDLAGGIMAAFPESQRPAGAVAVGLAIDRRAYCRMQRTSGGLRLESKDTLLKIEAGSATELPSEGVPGLVRHLLLVLGAQAGLHVVTQARVPLDAGLGATTALAVAVLAAGSRLLGRPLPAEDLPALLRGLPRPDETGAALLAAWGGVAATAIGEAPSAGERLRVDPARAEECLLLVDPGAPLPGAEVAPGEAAVRETLAQVAAGALRVKEALVSGAGAAAITALVSGEQEAWVRLGLAGRDGPAAEVTRIARVAGGAARPCGPGPKSLMLVWAEPGTRQDGPRERVAAALKAAGFRTFPCRLDLRGLEVEEA